ncbi:transposase, partial [Metallibacterium scheffleri]|uniref:transposase n=1 Tax=Metallibacterium scheffleri TaxID=993689 RepID=UPI0023F49048
MLAPGRRTVTGMICAADPEGSRAHDAYHRFFRAARWSTNALWKALVPHMVAVLCPTGTLVLDLDDTLYKKTGRKIDGAGTFRDAVRSTRNKVVYATGLNLVIVTLRVCPPWGGMPIGVPVGVRLHRKGGPTTTDLATEIITELASWLPDRSFSLCADGAYATLAGRGLPR